MDVELYTVTFEVTGNIILFTRFGKSEVRQVSTRPYVGINHECGDFSMLMYIISACHKMSKNYLSKMVWHFIGVYIINRTLHGRLEIRNFSSRVEKNISLVRCAHSSNIFQRSKSRREISYLRAAV